MTAAEKARVRKTLRQKLAELQNGGGRERLSSIVDEGDEIERLQLAAQRALTAASLDQETKLYRAVRAALERLDSGGYGRCMSCDKELPARRLAAIPWATMCAACQTAAEEEEKGPAEVHRKSDGSDVEDAAVADGPVTASVPRRRATHGSR